MSELAKIFEGKREEVETAKSQISLSDLKAMARDAEPTRGFRDALSHADKPIALIAEVKKASPSQGLIRTNFDATEIASIYEIAGAHALSVLTDAPHFQGSAENLVRAREATRLPVLRKDFIYDPYQVYEARAWGADAVLLIVAALEAQELMHLKSLATELGMDSLVEVHNEAEAQIAMKAGSYLIGVNNRDLSTFKTDLAVSDKILPMIETPAISVSESAIETQEDIDRVHRSGARAVLIGTAFCAAPNIGAKVQEVMGW